VLTARHWNSKELFATTYWTLIGPVFSREATARTDVAEGPACTVLPQAKFFVDLAA